MDSQQLIARHLAIPKNKKIEIEFEDVYYSVSVGRKGEKQILIGLSGRFNSGELTAIMGPSGAGKSTLLNILTGFQSRGMKGAIRSIRLESGCVSNKFKKDSCYILQDDQLNPLFTVKEIMAIATDLKRGPGISEKGRTHLVDNILDTLSLSACKDTRCGRLSGGQRKRLSIALELVDNPPVMFLDEPTTGLDSLSSFQCISTLKALARGGRTIVCTIHQPSASIFEMFDQVYVLTEGQCIYSGSADNTIPYLSSVGLNCPKYHNPADFLLEIASGDYGDFTDHLVMYSTQKSWKREIATSDISEDVTNFDDQILERRPPTELYRFWILLNRTMTQLYRDWTVTHLRLALHMIIGILLGLLYLNYGRDGSKTISNVSYCMITSVYLSYTAMMPAVLKFPLELPVLKKERFNNWYKLKTYYAAFLVTHVPIQMIYCLAYASVSYFLTAQPADASRFFMFVLVCCLVSLSAEGMGTVLGTTVNPVNGTFLGAISTALMLSVAGFLIFFSHMSRPFYILSYISYVAYSTEAFVQSLYGFERETLPCPSEELYCHYRVPGVILKELGMDKNNYWNDVLCLLAVTVLFRVVAFCTLRKNLSSG